MKTVTAKTHRAQHVAIVSDAHFRPRRSEHHASERRSWDTFVDRIDALTREVDVVVINGDLFDFDRGAQPWSHARQARALTSRYTGPLERWRSSGRVVLLSGNHDMWAAEALGAVTALDLFYDPPTHAGAASAPARRLRVEHGERFDPWAKRCRPFTSFVTWVSGHAEHPRATPILRALRFAEAVLSGDGGANAPHESGGGFYARIGRWLDRHPAYGAFVFGHTHEQSVRARDHGWIANAGSVEGEVWSYLWVDLDSFEVYALRWPERGPRLARAHSVDNHAKSDERATVHTCSPRSIPEAS